MLRYYFLAKGWSKGVVDGLDVFNRYVARFPYACRAVANAVSQGSTPGAKSFGATYAQEVSLIAGQGEIYEYTSFVSYELGQATGA